MRFGLMRLSQFFFQTTQFFFQHSNQVKNKLFYVVFEISSNIVISLSSNNVVININNIQNIDHNITLLIKKMQRTKL